MIKVIHIFADTNSNSASKWLLNFLKNFDREKFDVAVVLPEESELGEKIEEVGVRTIFAENIEEKSALVDRIKELREIIKAEEPDVVNTYGSLSAQVASKLCGVKIIDTRSSGVSTTNGIKKLLLRVLRKIIGGKAVGVSNAVCDSLVSEGFSADNIHLIYNGALPLERYDNEKRMTSRKELELDGKLAVGIFTELEEEQNHMMLLNSAAAAYELFPSFKFVIAGDGSLKNELVEKAEIMGISDAVVFTDYREDITELMNVIDINVITSKFETDTTLLLQGMSVAKPSVTTDTLGLREIIDSGVNGIVIPQDDVVSLTASLLKLAAEPELRISMGEMGAVTACDKFSLEQTCQKLSKLYEEI